MKKPEDEGVTETELEEIVSDLEDDEEVLEDQEDKDGPLD